MNEWIEESRWRQVVETVPVPSVDLVVVVDGGVVLAERTNEPARGEWFVPGGRVRKGEPLDDAVQRVAQSELGVGVEVEERLGAYDHFYATSEFDGVDKHYVAHGFVVCPDGEPEVNDDQHERVQVFDTRPSDCHEYVAAYLDDSLTVDV